MRYGRSATAPAILALGGGLIVGSIAMIGPARSSHHSPQRPPAADADPALRHESATPAPSATPSSRQRLVAWDGPVESLFFHPLILRPKLAFKKDALGQGFQDYFVTAREFRAILDELWRNDWTLVDVHRAASGHVRVPIGRKPLVLFEDDVNYYEYFSGRGLASRLVLDDNGDVRAEFERGSGIAHLTNRDVVTLVDRAVATHPELSAGGAKGVLALTGYEGLFGEHDLERRAARARVRAVAARLRATGWTLASHTFGHIDLANDSLTSIARDTTRWKRITRGLIGRTDLLVYPFGSRPTTAGRCLLGEQGFDIQFDIDIRPRRLVDDGIVVMSRRHVDGLAFETPRRLRPFFDVGQVRDRRRPFS
jgi:hypothetical protein